MYVNIYVHVTQELGGRKNYNIHWVFWPGCHAQSMNPVSKHRKAIVMCLEIQHLIKKKRS